MKLIRQKKPFLFLIILVLLFTVVGFSSVDGEERELEIMYPEISGYAPTIETPLPEYVKYIFNFAIWIVGIVAFAFLIIGGTKYVLSAGNPSLQTDARSQILSSLIGVIILISSYSILNTINPQMTIFTMDELSQVGTRGPGIWACKIEIDNIEEFMTGSDTISEDNAKEIAEEVKANCIKVSSSGSFPSEFEDKIKKIYIINESGFTYGVVLHKDSGFQGECQTIIGSQTPMSAHSVTPFFINTNSQGEGVTIYENRDFNEEVDGASTTAKIDIPSADMNPCYSIKIDEEKNWIAIASNDKGECEIFNMSDRNLEDNYLSSWCAVSWWNRWKRQPCINSLEVFKGRTF